MASNATKKTNLSQTMATTEEFDVTTSQDGIVNLEPILQTLGPKGRYNILQYCLQILGLLVYPIPWLCLFFQGYEPDHICNKVDNTTQLESYLGENVSMTSLSSIQYKKCSIDVIFNDSGTVTSHSLDCVNGVNFSGSPEISVVVEWSLVCEKAGLAKLSWSLPFICQVPGITLFAYLADWYGRKKVFASCGLVLMISGLSTSLAPTFPVYLAFTALNMTLTKGVMNSAYTMFMELLPHHSRPVSSVVDAVTWSSCSVVIAIVGYLAQNISWRYANLAFCSVYFFMLILPCVLDESLRWLLATGKRDQALRVLRKACRINGKPFLDVSVLFTRHHHHHTPLIEKQDREMDEFQGAPSREDIIMNAKQKRNGSVGEEAELNDDGGDLTNQERNVLQTANLHHRDASDDDILMNDGHDMMMEHLNHATAPDSQGVGVFGGSTDKIMAMEREKTEPKKYAFLDICRHRITLVNVLIVSAVWLTNNFYYYFLMLPSANLAGDRFLNFGILSFVEMPSTILTFFLMRRFNRKPLAIFFGMAAAVLMLLSVALIYIDTIAGIGELWSTITLYACKFCMIGSHSVLNVYILEIFPTGMRNTACGIADAVARIAPISAPFILLWTTDYSWIRGVVTGCVNILVSLSISLIPETRHQKLPDSVEEIISWSKTDDDLGRQNDAEVARARDV